MKVSDGFWMTKKGYSASFATEIYEVKATEHSLQLFVTTRWIENRGQTLEGPALTVTFTSDRPNCIKVSVDHFTADRRRGPEFETEEAPLFSPTVKCGEDGYELQSGDTRVIVGREGEAYRTEYRFGDRYLTGAGWRSTSLISEEAWLTEQRLRQDATKQFFAKDTDERSNYIREMLNLSVGEYIYGFGEKFTTFVKNGQTAEIWNNDGGTCTEQSYKSIPFYVSSRGYGVFVNHPEKVSFEVASETVSKTAFSVQGEHLEYVLMGGNTIAEVLSTYTGLTGRPALLPAYTFGLWLSTSFTTQYDEATVNFFADEMKRRGIPLSVFHFDCFWMREFSWCGFEWDKKMFPDPVGMLAGLKKKGLKISIWINPYIGQQAACFEECVRNGYFIKKKDGSVFQSDMWQPGLALIDFTNPQAAKWYADKIKGLLRMGVDAIKTDFGERIPTDVVYYDGSDPLKMHNFYSYLYNKVVFHAVEEEKGTGKACLFARSATVGGQKFPVHWGGDCFSDYASMAETLRGGLSLCLSGFGFFSHDISGFEETGSPDLYKRWTAFGLLSTHSRYHGNASYRVPWRFDEESCLVAKHFVNLKGRLMPYLYANAVQTHETGVPMMRAMVVDYAFDRNVLTLDTQYMLGDSLLVAPIFSEDGICEFYLPGEGIWTDIQTGETKQGGQWYRQKYDYFGLPLYAKPNSVLAFGNFEDNVEYDYSDRVQFVIYAPEEGKTAERKLYGPDGTPGAQICARRENDTLYVRVSNTDKPYTVKCVPDMKIETE